jgi:cytochrome c-type biogenesis protein CcmH/NrfG
MSGVDTIRGIIKDFFTVDALRDKTLLLQKEIDALFQRCVNLEKENADLLRKNNEFEKQVAELRAHDDFTEYRGAKFKRLPRGVRTEGQTPYCFHCLSPMWAMDFFPYECSKCGHKADFSKDDLPQILKELESVR